MTYRVLVTGSRDLRDRQLVFRVLDAALEGCDELVVVHGACPSGADLLASRWCRLERTPQWAGRVWEVPRPARWEAKCRAACKPGHRRPRRGSDYCPAAGNYRNQEMVDLGADVCLAFYQEGAVNAGTADCVRRAEAAGIPVRKFYGENAR